MRLATVKVGGGGEIAAIVLEGGVASLGAINDVLDAGWPTDLLSLLEEGRIGDLRSWLQGLEEVTREELADLVIPVDRVEYAPLYRRPRKIWGIGLNYVEHAGDLSETAPSEEPASFMRPDTTIIGPGRRSCFPGNPSG